MKKAKKTLTHHLKPYTGASGKTIIYPDNSNPNDRNLTSFLFSLGAVSKQQQVLSHDEEEDKEEEVPSAEESGSSYHPGIHLFLNFMKYFNYTKALK